MWVTSGICGKQAELEAIARGGGDVDMDQGEGGTDASRRLLGNYETPQRSLSHTNC